MKETINHTFKGINNMLHQSYVPAILNAAIDVEIFESLAIKPKNYRELAQDINTVENITESVLKVIEAVKLIEYKEGKYNLTVATKEYLLKAADNNQIAAIKSFKGSPGPLDQLANILKEGSSAPFNNKMWSDEKTILNMEQGAKAGMIQNLVSFAREVPGFEKCKKMCDIAGSSGYYSFALMKENKNLESHVYDLEAVCETAKKLKKNDPDFNRINYHSFDVDTEQGFEDNTDLFFCSHFLYEYSVTNKLVDFFRKINQRMPLGGLFISNHMCADTKGEDYLTMTIVELITRCVGYPTHQISEDTLKSALSVAGFGEFKVRLPQGNTSFPIMLLSAAKIKHI